MESPEDELLEEPKLSYERVVNDLSTIIQNDPITSTCLHSKFLVVGTVTGHIYVLDHLGNKVKGQDLYVHLGPVCCISIDEKGGYLVSCSKDRLVVYGLCDNKHNSVILLKRPINVVAIDPQFHVAGSGRRFVAGGDRVFLYEKGILTPHKCTELPSKEQKIRNMSWYGGFIAWATDFMVQIYDVDQRTIITRFKKDIDSSESVTSDSSERQDLCQFCWKDNKTLLVGWSNTIKVCSIKERSHEVMNEVQLKELPKKYVEIVSMFETDFFIHGLAPFNNSYLLTLSIDSLQSKPLVRILETFPNSYNEISKDLLTPRSMVEDATSSVSIESSSCQLLSLHEEGLYFIVCPKDVISAKPRDNDDHFEWLIQHSRLKECYQFVKDEANRLHRHSLREIEQLYMEELLNKNSPEGYSEAAQLCAQICEDNQQSWEGAIKRFCEMKQLKYLLPHLPNSVKGFHLQQKSYDFILQEFLTSDSVSFFKAIKEIPSELYSLKELTNQVIRCLANDPKNLVLNEALAELYTREGKFEDAVNIYLDYNDKTKIFSLIRNNNLISMLENRVDRLMQIDEVETAQLLVENMESIPIKHIVERFEKHRSQKYLVSYLHKLALKDTDLCIEYHDLMVKLYAQYKRESLLNFLKSSTNYRLEEAVRICKEYNLIKEVVFLLSRMGDLRDALKYIIESQGDINEAIDFCIEHQDPELWQDLIVYSMDNPEYISVLLKNIGTHIENPIDLIDRIPAGCEIEGLMPALVKILQDYQLQVSLEKSCRDLMAKDCFSLLEKQIRCQTQGIAVKEDQVCDHCNQPLFSETLMNDRMISSGTNKRTVAQGRIRKGSEHDNQAANGLIVFGCHHVFHEECCADLRTPPTTPTEEDLGPDSNGQHQMNAKTCRVCMSEQDYDSSNQIAPSS